VVPLVNSSGDNGSSHRGQAAVDRLATQFPNAIVVHTPVHASWLDQIQIYFSIVQRKALSPDDFTDLDVVIARLNAFEARYNPAARPFTWTFTTTNLNELLTRLDNHRSEHELTGATTESESTDGLSSSAHGAVGQAPPMSASRRHRVIQSRYRGRCPRRCTRQGAIMRHPVCRRLRFALPAACGAGLLSLASVINGGAARAEDPSEETAFIMGGTLNPQPDPSYVTAINDAYIQPNPDYTGFTPFGLYTPEGVNIPFISGLTLDQSVSEGQLILNNAILQAPPGSDLLVFGYSQSAIIATLEMNALDALPADERPNPADLAFMLTGDFGNPDGGFFERFTFNIPVLGIPFYGPTPPDTVYPTDIYIAQYDGVSDFPQYPLNVLADLNAVFGLQYEHTQYPHFTAAQIANAVPLATSPGYDGVTHYFMIPTENLPLLEPLRDIPLVGTPLADLLQPDLTVLVNLGYNPNGYADIPTPAQLFPGFSPLADLEQLARPLLNDLGVYLPSYPDQPSPDFNLVTILGQLVTGTYQGVRDALVDIGLLPASDFATTYPAVNAVDAVAAVAPTAVASSPAAPLAELGTSAAAVAPVVPDVTALGADPTWFTSVLDVLLGVG